MRFFSWNKKLHPIVAFVTSLTILIFAMIEANSIRGSYFLIGIFIWLAIFGCALTCLKVLPMFLVLGGIFFGISYFASGNTYLGFGMVNRFAAICLAIIPGLNTEPIRMTRSLAQLKMPRGLTLGMLISMSFGPTLKKEIHRVREAMKTRGAGSLWNPRIFYRAFLVPFIMRLVNISDILSLSVETRGFTLGKTKYTIYNKEIFVVSDLLFLLGIIGAMLLVVLL